MTDTTAESLAHDGFTPDEIANMRGGITEAATDIAAADSPTRLRWGLNDLMWGDDEETEDEPEQGTRPCGYGDYHDGHEWVARPDVWCPGRGYGTATVSSG